ncbi:DUF4097 family beta strand repeat-containing protein [Anaerostipes sp.]|uniref:DUF4097 family beta strand repeat-containing protein n=1 Tax=Anaerostipes sp. TaxID=1872530 RepID=UPI0025C681C1|nr:DUF4097 family beta strand repeat-containing protein [Anaerostipes sp.]MBS7009593.1 DUF4097 family beta strand repeat protein [Anaerostipes sp.]
MKKFYKICLILCLIFTVAGTGCIIAAAAMGFSFTDTYYYVRDRVNGYTNRDENSTAETLQFPKDKVKHLKISVGSRDLSVVRGEGSQIVLKTKGKRKLFQSQWNESMNELVIESRSTVSRNFFFDYGYEGAVLSIPKDVNLDTFRLDVGSGDFVSQELAAKSMKVQCGSGDINLSGIQSNVIDISCGSGDIEADVWDSRENYRYDITVGSGDVTLDGHELEHDNKKGAWGSGNKSIDVDCGSGNIDINFLNNI